MFNYYQTSVFTCSGLAGSAFYLNSREQQTRPVHSVFFLDWMTPGWFFSDYKLLEHRVTTKVFSGWEHVM